MTDVFQGNSTDSKRQSELPLDHEAVYSAYHQKVLFLMRRMVGRQDAPDLAQQVFVKVIESGSSFQERSSVWTWLYRVAANEALTQLRRKQRRKYSSLSREPETKSDAGLDKLGNAREAIEKALAQLDPTLRVVFVLKEVEELSYREIAETVDIPEGTVGSRLSRARHELRRYLNRVGVHV